MAPRSSFAEALIDLEAVEGPVFLLVAVESFKVPLEQSVLLHRLRKIARLFARQPPLELLGSDQDSFGQRVRDALVGAVQPAQRADVGHGDRYLAGLEKEIQLLLQPKDPNDVPGGTSNVASTIGGNSFQLVALAPDPAAPPADNLHLYWDSNVVNNAMRAAGWPGAEQDFARLLAAKAPASWQTAGDPETWAEQWATEILPLARAAYSKLKLIGFKEHDRCTWTTQGTPGYSQWASERARVQIQKAGFRLAALLSAIFEP